MSFANDIKRWSEKAGKTIDQAVRAVRLQAVELVIEKMPVDTGQARGSVIASIGSPANSPKILDKTGTTTAAAARAQGAINAPSNNVFYFTSNLPYVKELEDGSSRQAPQGMFKVSAIQLTESIKQVVKNATD
jgi:hypothetical protein